MPYLDKETWVKTKPINAGWYYVRDTEGWVYSQYWTLSEIQRANNHIMYWCGGATPPPDFPVEPKSGWYVLDAQAEGGKAPRIVYVHEGQVLPYEDADIATTWWYDKLHVWKTALYLGEDWRTKVPHDDYSKGGSKLSDTS